MAQWNSYFNAMIFLTDRSKYPLQLYLREILLTAKTYADTSMVGGDPEAAAKMARTNDGGVLVMPSDRSSSMGSSPTASVVSVAMVSLLMVLPPLG